MTGDGSTPSIDQPPQDMNKKKGDPETALFVLASIFAHYSLISRTSCTSRIT
jgi:hypothetical protein